MKDTNLTHKFWARAVAFVLFCLLAALFFGCVIAAIECYDRGWYDLNKFSSFDSNLTQQVYLARYTFLTVGLLSGIVCLALFIFLLCSAGHSEGANECTLIRQDVIPFDLYLAICIILGCVLLMMVSESISAHFVTSMVVIEFAVALIAAVFMAFCMTLAARIKARKLWRNTVAYYIISALVRLCATIPMAWRTAATYCGFIFINAIFAAFLFTGSSGGFLSFLMLLALDGATLFWLVKCAAQMKQLKKAGEALAEGDLTYTVDTSKLKRDFLAHGENLNSISRGLSKAVNERMKSERFKTELITNVSHDLKTPLTSIVTYIDLLQKQDIQDEQSREYIDTIARQSAKLRKLTEDLIDASKASSGAINVNLEKVNISELLRQSAAEYDARMTASGITSVLSLPDEDVYATADGRLLWRVLDNLMQNICRHGMTGTRAYISAEHAEGAVHIVFKNISSQQLNIAVEELLERFVQGDESRNKEGSGLGLSIAQSLTELMGGKMQIALDGDLFKTDLTFKEE